MEVRAPSTETQHETSDPASTDVYPTWESIFYSDFQHFYQLWQKAHPDMEFGTTFEQYDKMRHQGDIDIYVVQDTISSTK